MNRVTAATRSHWPRRHTVNTTPARAWRAEQRHVRQSVRHSLTGCDRRLAHGAQALEGGRASVVTQRSCLAGW